MKLFEGGKIGKLTIKNRVVMAPMGHNLVELDGRMQERAIDYYVARAKGGTGLIITCATGVTDKIEKQLLLPMVNSKIYLARLNELAEGVHDYGAKIAIQLSAGMGRNIAPGLLKKRGAVAPSAVPSFYDPKILARPLTVEEIKHYVKAFGTAAEVIRDAGIDIAELHAHGSYLIDQFMTELWNKRTDEYGGSLEGRLRFPIEIVESIKRGAGADFPVIFRFGLTHYFKGGREINEGLEICRRMEAAGVDAFHIDAGCYETRYWTIPPQTLPPGCLVDLAEAVKKVVSIPIIIVGRLGYPELAEKVLQDRKADFIALGRPLLADPEWPNKVKEGRVIEIRPCIGCYDGCLDRIFKSLPVTCTVNPATGDEKEMVLKPADKKKSVLVIGGGPGGMEAALITALRGHQVTLWEKGNVLGGNLIAAGLLDFKHDYKNLVSYLSAQLEKQGVMVELNKEATPELVRKAKPNVVFIATGGRPIIPEIPGIESALTATDLLLNKKEAGNKVVIIGGGLVGGEMALHLLREEKNVTIVEMLDSIVNDMFIAARLHLLKMLNEAEVKVMTGTNVMRITDKGVIVTDKDGEQITLEADTVVIACGFKPNNQLFEALKDMAPEVYAVGDCVEPRKVFNAMRESFRTACVV